LRYGRVVHERREREGEKAERARGSGATAGKCLLSVCEAFSVELEASAGVDVEGDEGEEEKGGLAKVFPRSLLLGIVFFRALRVEKLFSRPQTKPQLYSRTRDRGRESQL
jgi:hypothetical protein